MEQKSNKPFLFNIINRYIWPVEKEERFNLENPNQSINGFTVSEILGGSARSKAGVAVSVDNATTLSAVYRCVAILAGIISYLPKKIYIDDETDGRVEAKSHNTYLLFKRRMSRAMTSPLFFERAIWHLLLHGNHMAEIEFKKNNISGFRLIDPRTFKEVREMNGAYWYFFTDRDQPIKDEYIINVPHLGDNAFRGLSTVTKAKEDLGMEMARRNTGGGFWADGGRPEGMLVTSQRLQPAQMAELKKNFKEAKKEGGTIVAPFGVDYKEMSMTPQDQEFIMSGNFSIGTICRWFGVPLDKLAELSRATLNNIEQQAIAFLQDTIAPIVNKIEAEYSSKCFTLASEQNMYMEMNMDAYQRADSQAQAELMRSEIQNSGLTPNEWRKLKNRPALAGGDQLYMQLNMAPTAKLEEIQTKKTAGIIAKNARELAHLFELEQNHNGNGKH